MFWYATIAWVVDNSQIEYCHKTQTEKRETNHIKTALLDRLALLSEHPCSGGLNFQSFLIMPIQRITRYVLLLAVRLSCDDYGLC